ncbi:damage-inducible protein CinA [Rhodomicrobium udaipurense JA643]|uniref:CinA family protein n=1 Tax=Rhodomicrobium udaipurense TaxID=1202716 RepID=A0A8I1GIU4_9HYPH|nr:CinA family protein [Rhodomicrobium udaipurense]KAI93953.1 damage-inducible protein CinA [Rhodomicrobium udaipurense JA643]MBJ7544625.1 CinA family protein [Rhodomicrobium udaipurense]
MAEELSGRAYALAADALAKARENQLFIATAESCTGGLVAAALTAVPGSSSAFDRGFVTYSNEAKADMLGVDPALIAAHGAVSKEVALAMAKGALAHSHAGIAVSITGIAGPDGGSAEKPVGLVHFAAARTTGNGVSLLHREERFGDIGRAEVRARSVETALVLLIEATSRDHSQDDEG